MLELDKERGKRFVRILLYLGMRNYPSSVISGALNLFFRQFRQRQELLDSIGQVFQQTHYENIFLGNSLKCEE